MKQPSLFAPQHDAGGRRSLKMQRGMLGDAVFDGPNGEYRPVLTRTWTKGAKNIWLWVGLNPSVASAYEDDPTIRKELKFTIRNGGDGYIKCNVMDYRASYPENLLKPGVVPRSPGNLDHLREQAARASVIVAAWGALHVRFQHFAQDALLALTCTSGKMLKCVGRTDAGFPRHPLYVKDDKELEDYNDPAELQHHTRDRD